jgi:hypothetical protein
MAKEKLKDETKLMLLGLMTLAGKQYSDLENTRRTTAIVLRDEFLEEVESGKEFQAHIADHLSDLIYGEEVDTSPVRLLELLMEKLEFALDRHKPKNA